MSETTSAPQPTSTSSTAWKTARRRRHLLDLMLLDPEATIEAWLTVPEFAAEFADVDDVLMALHEQWHRLVLGCLDTELDTGGGHPEANVRHAYQRALDDLPHLRLVLQRYAGHGVVATLTQRELMRVAAAVGLARPGSSTAEAEALVTDIVDQLRATTPGRLHTV